MKIAIYITGDPLTSGAANSAYQFSKAALDAGHELSAVFVMHDAMQLAISDSSDTFLWQSLCKQYDLTVSACITAMDRHEIDPEQLKQYFVADGLAAVTDKSLSSDKVITFH